MAKMKIKRVPQRGFTLIEMMMVLLVLTVVTGVIFDSISSVQQRYRVEESKIDLTQEARAFLDQLVRDLHQTGFPGKRGYSATPADSSGTNAVGLVAVSRTDIWFEGDVDGDGVVDSVRYQLVSNGGECPCTLRRSQASKVDGTAPDAQGTNWSTEVQNVLNSTGTGNSPWTIAGTNPLGDNDTIYTDYKADPVFRFYDKNGDEVTSGIPNDLSTVSSGETLSTLESIRNVKVTINVMSSSLDNQFKKYPATSMTGSARILNSKY